MTDQDTTSTAAKGRAFTPRAVCFGLLLVVAFSLITPVNDWLLRNTYMYSQHMAVGVFLLAVMFGVLINPLLGRHRLASGEMMVIIAMLFVLGGVVSSGLVRIFTGIAAGPAKVIPTSTELSAFVDDDGNIHLPKGVYLGLPEQGVPDINDPEYRYEIDGFFNGLGTKRPSVGHRAHVVWAGPDGIRHAATALAQPVSDITGETVDLGSDLGKALAGRIAGAVVPGPDGDLTVISVQAPPIPWSRWLGVLWAWAPLLISGMIAFLAIAALVRHQWIHNERLTYPIANVIVSYLEDPQPGHRFAPVFRSRAFWIGFAVVSVWLTSYGLSVYGLNQFPLPTSISLWESFDTEPFNLAYANWAILRPRISFGTIGLIFFLSADLSFSMWFCFLAANAIYALMRIFGVPVSSEMPSKISMGGWVIQGLVIVWVGRTYYLALLKAAFRPSSDPAIAQARPFTWAFLASSVGMVVAMMSLGAQFGDSVIAALCYLGVGLVLSRMVAEAGIPFVQTPMGWSVSGLIYSMTGFAAPMAALVPLTMLGQSLCADPREHLMPFATNAEYLTERAGAPRRAWFGTSMAVLAIGTLVGGAVMLWCAYGNAGHQALDTWWRGGPLLGSLGPIATASVGGDAIGFSTTWTCYGIGAAITGGLAFARLAFAWWPIHPIGILILAGYPTYVMWFSFFLGWLFKALVMRYGGMQLYRQLKPAALGMIAAEAVIAGIFLIIGLIAGACEYPLPGQPKFLAG